MSSQVLEWSVRAALIAAGTALVLGVMRIRAAEARHAAWTVVLAAMLALPAWNTWGPKVAAPVLPAAVAQIPAADGSAMPEDLMPGILTLQAGQAPQARQAGRPAPLARAWNWEWVALGCYFLGLGAMLLRLAAGTVRARALVRRATAADGVRSSAECAAPLTVGWLRPVVVLPEGWRRWPAAELDAVLTHEREHVRRRDPLVQWLALLNRCVFWFHPLAWWLERKLSALAEDACDAAVLRRGHDPHAYSEYLIELARSVQQAGARVPVWGAAMDGGMLTARIRRIVEGRPAPALSRNRAALASALCGLTIAAFAACKLERAQKPAAGQPTMNDLMHRRADQNSQYQAQSAAMLEEVHNLTPEQANALVAQLKANPQDEQLYFKLVRYYQYKSDPGGLDALTLWYIEHQPGGKVWPWSINPQWDRAGYEQGKRLWLAHLKDANVSSEIYRRTARFLEGGDRPLAERILLEGQPKYPGENWAAPLGELYALILVGGEGPRADGNVVRSVSMKEAHGPYAQSVRSKLAASKDPHLLTQAALWLVRWGRRESGVDFDVAALANSYVDQALSIDPDNRAAHSNRLMVEEAQTFERMRATTPERWGASDRLRFLRRQVEEAVWRGKTGDAAAQARDLLAAAARSPNDPDYSNAVFFGNMALCNAALHQGDKRAASRYLLAASETPPTERLRYGVIDLSVARHLVDWGERDAVAQFLERCSKFNIERGKDMAEWAAQIRTGVNPDLLPYNASI
jgi:hypothetical protein